MLLSFSQPSWFQWFPEQDERPKGDAEHESGGFSGDSLLGKPGWEDAGWIHTPKPGGKAGELRTW